MDRVGVDAPLPNRLDDPVGGVVADPGEDRSVVFESGEPAGHVRGDTAAAARSVGDERPAVGFREVRQDVDAVSTALPTATIDATGISSAPGTSSRHRGIGTIGTRSHAACWILRH